MRTGTHAERVRARGRPGVQGQPALHAARSDPTLALPYNNCQHAACLKIAGLLQAADDLVAAVAAVGHLRAPRARGRGRGRAVGAVGAAGNGRRKYKQSGRQRRAAAVQRVAVRVQRRQCYRRVLACRARGAFALLPACTARGAIRTPADLCRKINSLQLPQAHSAALAVPRTRCRAQLAAACQRQRVQRSWQHRQRGGPAERGAVDGRRHRGQARARQADRGRVRAVLAVLPAAMKSVLRGSCGAYAATSCMAAGLTVAALTLRGRAYMLLCTGTM